MDPLEFNPHKYGLSQPLRDLTTGKFLSTATECSINCTGPIIKGECLNQSKSFHFIMFS